MIVALLLSLASDPSALRACPADRCGLASALQACPAPSASAVSSSTGAEEKVFFRNDAGRAVRLLAVDEHGAEHEHTVIGPSGRYTAITHQGKVWRVRLPGDGDSDAGRLLLEHKVSPVVIEPCECAPAPYVDCGRPDWYGYRSTFDPVVFENASPMDVQVTWFDGTCEEVVRTDRPNKVLKAFSSLRLLSTYGHTFRVHPLGRTDITIRQYTIGDVVIRNCDEEHVASAAGGGQETAAESLAVLSEEIERLRTANARTRALIERTNEAVGRAALANATVPVFPLAPFSGLPVLSPLTTSALPVSA